MHLQGPLDIGILKTRRASVSLVPHSSFDLEPLQWVTAAMCVCLQPGSRSLLLNQVKD